MQMDGLELKVPPPLAALIVCALMWLADHIMGGGLALGALFYAGLLLMVLGFALAFTGFRTLVGNRTTPSPTKIDRAKKLVTSGLYRFSRNPMYLGVVIVLIGLAAVFGNPWLLAGPLAFGLYMNRFQIRPEERMMAAKFGADYAAYKSRVRRWI